jgi:hypothetical protein
VKKLAPSLSVKHAGTADSATNATHATSADSAANATHATSADSATTATSATSATNATFATGAANAAALSGLAANQLVRATSATAGTGTPCGTAIAGFNAFATSTFTTVVSKTVTAPVSGVLLILGHVSFELANNGVGPSVSLQGQVAVDGTAMGKAVEGESDSSTLSSCGAGEDMSVDGAVPVTAGNHTIAYQIERSAGTGDAWVDGASVTTLFLPFGNAGTQGVLGLTHSTSRASSKSNR